MSDTVLVTGAFGLVGSATVERLRGDGRTVVATDLDIPANRAAAEKLRGVEVRWADLTDEDEVNRLVSEVAPAAIVHLAAIIPPFCYMRRELARKVNVDATAALIRAAEKQPAPPRFVLASSIAVYGARNPHRTDDLLTADTPPNPSDIYGAHKIEAENLLRASDLDWLILRLGGVMPLELFGVDRDMMKLERVTPVDGRVQMVDVRDVASAFAAATCSDVTHEVLLIAGDDSTRQRFSDVGAQIMAAMGLPGVMPPGRPGDPNSDTDWFHGDWMDTARAQEVLKFQHHSWTDMLAEIRRRAGWKRYPLRLAAPLAGLVLHFVIKDDQPGPYIDPWTAIREMWGDPSPDRSPG